MTDVHHVMPDNPDTLLTRADVARILRVSKRTLAQWATKGEGPPYRKIGPQKIVYRAGDLAAWIRERPVKGGSVGGGDGSG